MKKEKFKKLKSEVLNNFDFKKVAKAVNYPHPMKGCGFH